MTWENQLTVYHAHEESATNGVAYKRRDHALPDIVAYSDGGAIEYADGDEEHVGDNAMQR